MKQGLTIKTRVNAIFPTVLLLAVAIPSARANMELRALLEFQAEVQYQEIEQQIIGAHNSAGQGMAKIESGHLSRGDIHGKQPLIWASDLTPLEVQLRRTEAMIKSLKSMRGAPDLKLLEKKLNQIRERKQNPYRAPSPLGIRRAGAEQDTRALAKAGSPAQDERELFKGLMKIQRSAAFSNPLLDFDDLLFLGYKTPKGDDHMCDQYYGWNAVNGSGIYILKNFKTNAPTLVNVLENSMVVNGRFKGQRLKGGAFLSPDLSWDGKTVAFAWTNETDKCYHIFKVNIDGTQLVQLTDGTAPFGHLALANTSQNDFDPCWLPNGRIAFISERRGGYLRCSPGRPCPTYTLFSMEADGTDILPLSYHETNEWHPSVNNDGMIVYTRWDYVDRDDCIAQHLWLTYTDGRDPRSPHGNYPLPWSTFNEPGFKGPVDAPKAIASYDGKYFRPNGVWNIRAIPDSRKYIATAGPHHGRSFGQLVMIDPGVEDDNKMGQIKGITSNQTNWPDAGGPWGTAWPLSEDYYLCSYNADLVLLSSTGVRELIYTASQVPGAVSRLIDPIPVQARLKPPVIPVQTWQGLRGSPNAPNATISVMNVNVSDVPLPQDVKIKWMRLVQVIPQPQARMNTPTIGFASESLVRMPLGVVPVEADGSVYCEAPVGKEIFFQLLDDQGMAVQSMRSGTYVHPGEKMSCVGCHENKWAAPPPIANPLAMQRAPSRIMAEVPDGAVPFNWHRLVKPVLEAKCAGCHRGRNQPPDMGFASLKPYSFYFPYWTATDANFVVYSNGELPASGSRTTPGRYGARESRLVKGGYLKSTHYGVDLTDQERRRITLWLDMNSNELGAYTRVAEQRQGKAVWPELDVDPANPLGVERRAVPIRERANANLALKLRQSSGKVRLLLPGRVISEAVVSNAAGRILHRKPGAGTDAMEISVRHWRPGAYLVKAFSDGQSFQTRFIIRDHDE